MRIRNHNPGISAAILFIVSFYIFISTEPVFAFEKTIVIPAESPQGVEVELKKGGYTVIIEGGAIALFYPINPNYRWMIGIAVGIDVEGYQDKPNIGTLYFEPNPAAHSQTEAEQQAVKAAAGRLAGTLLEFVLAEDKKVRFWVSDFDYSDNSGMIKLRIQG